MATAALPKPPSHQQFQQQLRRLMPGLTVYGPFDEWQDLRVFGLTLFLPPDLNGAIEPHPQTGEPTVCDGTLVIRDRYPTMVNPKTGALEAQKDSSGKAIEGQTAQAFVEYLTHREHYGQMGLVWLPGLRERDPKSPDMLTDDEIKRLARQAYLEFQRKQDERILEARAEFKSNWEKHPAHRGTPCPPPNDRENAAMERLQERRLKKSIKYECDVPDCPGYAVDDWEKFSKHMKAAHDKVVKRSMYEGEIGGVSGAVASVSASADPIEEKSEADRPRRRGGRRKAS